MNIPFDFSTTAAIYQYCVWNVNFIFDLLWENWIRECK